MKSTIRIIVFVGLILVAAGFLLVSCVDIEKALPSGKEFSDPDTDGTDVWLPIPKR